MSFAEPKDVIEENDTVILYLTMQSVHAIDVVPFIKNKKEELVENIFQTNYGALKVQELVGVKYGSKVLMPHNLSATEINGFKLLVDYIIKGMGLCIATDARSVDSDIAASNTNHLYSGY